MRLAVSRDRVWEPCHVDDLRSLLDPLTSAGLERAFLLGPIPSKRRIQVAMAVAGIEEGALMVAAGLVAPQTANKNTMIWRWLTGVHKMPMGVGFRFARVFGVNAEVLCEGYV